MSANFAAGKTYFLVDMDVANRVSLEQEEMLDDAPPVAGRKGPRAFALHQTHQKHR